MSNLNVYGGVAVGGAGGPSRRRTEYRRLQKLYEVLEVQDAPEIQEIQGIHEIQKSQ